MRQIKLKISDMFRQHRVRTVIEALTALKDVQHAKANLHKNEMVVQFGAARITTANPAEKIEAGFGIPRNVQPLVFIVGVLIILFSIAGCSDMPYTSSVLTLHEVDRYLVSTDGNVVCFQDGLDSTCIRLGSQIGNSIDTTNGPDIHIYPEKRLYLFYHEGKPILGARRVGDTSQNGGGNNNGNTNGGNDGNNGGGNNNGNNGNNNGGNNGGGNNNGNDDNSGGTNGDDNNGGGNDNGNDDNPGGTNGDDDNNDNPPNSSDDGHGWIIWVYYPDGTIPQDPPTLSESGVTITINGKQLVDEDITGFAQFIGPNDEAGIQFFYPTQSAELLDLRVQMEGIVDPESTVKFNINYLWNSQ